MRFLDFGGRSVRRITLYPKRFAHRNRITLYGIALSQSFFSPFTEYYGRRKVLYDVISWEKLDYIIKSNKIRYFITNFRNFQYYLTGKFEAIYLPDDFVAYELIPQNLARPQNKNKISFANKLDLVDYSFKVLPYGYLFLEYEWKKSAPATHQFKVFVHFVDEKGNYIFGQDHFIANGLIDMTIGEPKSAKEKYIIPVPSSALGKNLSVYVGLYSPVTWERVEVLNFKTPDHRVKLGEIQP